MRCRPPSESGPSGGAPTQRQQEVLAFIHSFKVEHEYAPTVREIGEHFDFASTNAVNDYLLRLERLRLLVRTPSVARSLRLTESGKALAEAYRGTHAKKSSTTPGEGNGHV